MLRQEASQNLYLSVCTVRRISFSLSRKVFNFMRLTRARAVLSISVLLVVLAYLCYPLIPASAEVSIATLGSDGANAPLSTNSATAVTMEVKAGFDGNYKEYAWLPMQVTLSVPAGQPIFQGRVEASFSNFSPNTALFRRSVQLTAPARKTVWLYLGGPRLLRQIQVRLVADDGTEIIAPVSRDVTPLSDSNFLMGVVSDDTSALNYLSTVNIGREALAYTPFLFSYNYNGNGSNSNAVQTLGSQPRVTIAHLTLADLPPNGIGWNSLDGLVLADLNTNYAGDQEGLKTALSNWLSQGAALFVAGDSVLRHAPFARNFLPVQSGEVMPPPRSIAANKLSGLQRFTQNSANLPNTNLIIADTNLNTSVPGSKSLIEQDSKPLLATRPYGLGQVWFFGSELKPLRDWDGMTPFWKELFKDYRLRENYTTAARRSHDGPYQEYSLRLTPSPQTPELPGPWWLAGFLALYIMVIGPANYLVLRRIDRREWAWLTVPALTIIFSLGTYTVGNLSAQSDMVLSRLSVITLAEGNDGKLSGGTSGFAGLYSNGRNDVEVKVADESLASGIFEANPNNYNYSGNPNAQNLQATQQGPGGGFGRISMGIRAQRSFVFENDSVSSEGIRARLKIVNGNLEGTVENLSNKEWEDVSLVLPGATGGGTVQKIGNLKPGEKRQVNASNRVPNTTPNYLVQTMTGVANFSNYQGPPNSVGRSYNYTPYYLNGGRPNQPASQKAMALETLIGPNGDGLLKDSNRFYVFGWRSEDKPPTSPISIEGRNIQNYDMTLLFEPLSAE